MSRIFFSLSIASLVLVTAALVVGLLGGDYNDISARLRSLEESRSADQAKSNADPNVRSSRDTQIEALLTELRQVQRHARIHILLGLLATLLLVFVQSIGITYFIGTGRWCKEVVETYDLAPTATLESAKLKRQAFPFAMLGIASAITIAALGAAADPGTLRATTSHWVAPHYWAAIIGLVVIGASLWVQHGCIRRNQESIDRLVGEVRSVRLSRGLEVE